jgi:hypothetical protein
MPKLGLEPNTCSSHELNYSTLPPGLLMNASNFRKYRRHFRSAVEHMGCRFGTVININSRLLQISRGIGALRKWNLTQVTAVNGM